MTDNKRMMKKRVASSKNLTQSFEYNYKGNNLGIIPYFNCLDPSSAFGRTKKPSSPKIQKTYAT